MLSLGGTAVQIEEILSKITESGFSVHHIYQGAGPSYASWWHASIRLDELIYARGEGPSLAAALEGAYRSGLRESKPVQRKLLEDLEV
jgi:hypothetical protein